MRITPKATLSEDINELRAQDYEVDDANEHVPGNIPKP